MRVSILTPVLPAASDYLADCEATINDLTYTLGYYGIIVQWLVAIDGPGSLAHEPLADHVVRLPRHVGVAQARNALLPLAKGDWVIPLDCDDLFDLTGMADIGQFLIDCPDDLGWVAANRTLLGGEKTPHWSNTGRVYRPGELSQHWSAPFPFHPNSLCIRRAVIQQIGGWPDLPANEDLALALMLGEHAQGRLLTEVMTRYRAWPKQAVAQPCYPNLKAQAFKAIETLLNQHRVAQGRTPVPAPMPGQAHGTVALAASA